MYAYESCLMKNLPFPGCFRKCIYFRLQLWYSLRVTNLIYHTGATWRSTELPPGEAVFNYVKSTVSPSHRKIKSVL